MAQGVVFCRTKTLLISYTFAAALAMIPLAFAIATALVPFPIGRLDWCRSNCVGVTAGAVGILSFCSVVTAKGVANASMFVCAMIVL